MINQEYYDLKTGKLKPVYQWQIAHYKEEYPDLDQQARVYAALFVYHPELEPYEVYLEKIKELINHETAELKAV